MKIPFLSLKDVTALHGVEINEAVSQVVNNGWYLQGKEMSDSKSVILNILVANIQLVVQMVWTPLFGFFVHI